MFVTGCNSGQMTQWSKWSVYVNDRRKVHVMKILGLRNLSHLVWESLYIRQTVSCYSLAFLESCHWEQSVLGSHSRLCEWRDIIICILCNWHDWLAKAFHHSCQPDNGRLEVEATGASWTLVHGLVRTYRKVIRPARHSKLSARLESLTTYLALGQLLSDTTLDRNAYRLS